MYFIIRPEWIGLDPDTVYVPKIPIAFEVGLLTKVLPERIIRVLNGTDDAKDFLGALRRGATGTLNMNPIPQFMKPLMESALNVNFYTMSDIVHYYSETNAADQARAGTGETAIQLAKITGISAEKIQHVLIQYTGTLGMYALLGVDSISRELAGSPTAPAMNLGEYPFLQRFLQDELGGGDLQSFYALREALTSLTAEIAWDEKHLNFEQADERMAESWPLLSRKRRIDYLDRQISNLRKQEVLIRAESNMTAEEKRKFLRQIKSLKSEILTGIKKFSHEINSAL